MSGLPHCIGILAGPTASGKSALSLALAERHNLAIISGDSMQVYRNMRIGTGALPDNERRGIPHYLIGIADPAEDFHAARFVEEATKAALTEYRQHGRRSLVVGGTGMWLEALREGLFDGPGRDEEIRDRLRKRLEEAGEEALHNELAAVDSAMAADLSPRDTVRVIRALEVMELTGKPLSQWYAEDQVRRAKLGPLMPLAVIDRPRSVLYQRINRRVEEMIAEGWLEEARYLYELNLPDHSPAKKALGYRELFPVIAGEISLEATIPEIQKATRRFAKRQMTWFRGQRETLFIQEPRVELFEKAFGLS